MWSLHSYKAHSSLRLDLVFALGGNPKMRKVNVHCDFDKKWGPILNPGHLTFERLSKPHLKIGTCSLAVVVFHH